MSQWMEVTHLPLGVICIHNQLHPVTDPFQSGSNKGPPAGTEFRSKGNPPSRGRAPGQVWAGLLPRASPPRGAGRSVCGETRHRRLQLCPAQPLSASASGAVFDSGGRVQPATQRSRAGRGL